MFKFMKEFRIVTVWDYTNDHEMHKTKTLRHAQFDDVVKHFGIGWSKGTLRLVPYPPELLKKGNIIRFGGTSAVQMSWRCVISPEKWTKFCEEVNAYVKDKDYATFTVYDAP